MDNLHPTARSYIALAAAFAVATAVRSVCFNPRLPIFGQDLAKVSRGPIHAVPS